MRHTIVDAGILDMGLLDRNEAVVERLASLFALMDRMREAVRDLWIHHFVERILIALPIGFEHHAVSGFGTFDETGDVKLGISGSDRTQSRGGAGRGRRFLPQRGRQGRVRRFQRHAAHHRHAFGLYQGLFVTRTPSQHAPQAKRDEDKNERKNDQCGH